MASLARQYLEPVPALEIAGAQLENVWHCPYIQKVQFNKKIWKGHSKGGPKNQNNEALIADPGIEQYTALVYKRNLTATLQEGRN